MRLAPGAAQKLFKQYGHRNFGMPSSRDRLRIRQYEQWKNARDQYEQGKRGLEGDMRTLPWRGPKRSIPPWFGWRGQPGMDERPDRGGIIEPPKEKDPIKEMYRELLQREADVEGFDYWSDELSSGDMTLDEIRNAISNSAEAQELQESGRSLKDDVIDPGLYTNWHDMKFPPQVVPFDQGPKEPMRSPGIRRLQKQLQIQPDR